MGAVGHHLHRLPGAGPGPPPRPAAGAGRHRLRPRALAETPGGLPAAALLLAGGEAGDPLAPPAPRPAGLPAGAGARLVRRPPVLRPAAGLCGTGGPLPATLDGGADAVHLAAAGVVPLLAAGRGLRGRRPLRDRRARRPQPGGPHPRPAAHAGDLLGPGDALPAAEDVRPLLLPGGRLQHRPRLLPPPLRPGGGGGLLRGDRVEPGEPPGDRGGARRPLLLGGPLRGPRRPGTEPPPGLGVPRPARRGAGTASRGPREGETGRGAGGPPTRLPGGGLRARPRERPVLEPDR